MATAGTGDVLTGIVAALFAQGLRSNNATSHAMKSQEQNNGCLTDTEVALRAAATGAWVHAMAGDRAAVPGQRGLVASDLLHEIRAFVN